MDEMYNIYLEQAKMLHKHAKVWKGHMLKRYLPQIEEVIKEHNIDTNSILDYGCGKSLYHPKGWNATRYDPAVPHFEVKPEKGKKFDLVICTDVLEHIPETSLPTIIDELFSYSSKYVFATAATKPAGKVLPNGMNAHATVKPKEWWMELFGKYDSNKYTLDFTEKDPKHFKKYSDTGKRKVPGETKGGFTYNDQ